MRDPGRRVLHYAYPDKNAARLRRPAIIEELKERGFGVSDAAAGDGLVLTDERNIGAVEMELVTAELAGWFASRGWLYDGWERAVSRPDGA